MKAVILSIGDELVLGQTVDTNGAWLSAQLARRGIPTLFHKTIADDGAEIALAIAEAAEKAEIVISSGGLGPTEDDLTRFALADVMGVKLVEDEPSVRHIAEFFRRRDRVMPERNKVQAMCPAGAEMLETPAGTAPGIRTRLHDADCYFVPGVPREMRVLFERHIVPALPPASGWTILSSTIHTFGKGESDVAELLGDLMDRARNPKVGTTVARGIVSVRIRSEFQTADEARSALDETAALVTERLGELVFGRDGQTLEQAVGRRLADSGKSLVTAESCTGGLVGKYLTDIAGSSDYYLGGWVTYTCEAKQRELGVPADLLQQHGAVSEPVARAMAEGALRESDADYALAITGIAGPGGGTDKKPVGLVWFALGERDGERIDVNAEKHVFPGDRPMVRDRAARTALNMLRLRLLG